MTSEQATRLTRAFEENLTEDDGETLTRIEVRQMADGSGSWALFAETQDVAGHESVYRTVVDRAGGIVGSESEALR